MGKEKEKELIEYPEQEQELEVTEYPQNDDDNDMQIVTTDNLPPGRKIVKLDLNREKYIPLVITATGEQSKISCSTKLRLFIGRIYYLPVDLPKEILTEKLKTSLDLIDKIDVRMVKEGFACVIPLVHNVVLVHGQRIAIIQD